MTKKEQKEVRRAVKGLPDVVHKTETVLSRIQGHELIDRGITEGEQVGAIDPKKTYRVPVPRPINHKTVAEGCFTRGGMPAVHAYCAQVRQKLEENKQQAPQIHEKQA